MKAKDTVIKLDGRDNPSLQIAMESILQNQAEISFKLGATQAIAKTINPANELYQKAKQEGRKEVVDWVDEDLEYSSAWQEKKKEWGIENDKDARYLPSVR